MVEHRHPKTIFRTLLLPLSREPQIDHTILAFGMDRYDTSGDAQLGFWFLGENPQPVASGNFVKSGTTAPAQHQRRRLARARQTSPTEGLFRPSRYSSGTTGRRGATGHRRSHAMHRRRDSGGQAFAGSPMLVPLTAPWTTRPKMWAPTTRFPRGAFFEGAIDLTALGHDGLLHRIHRRKPQLHFDHSSIEGLRRSRRWIQPLRHRA